MRKFYCIQAVSSQKWLTSSKHESILGEFHEAAIYRGSQDR